MAQVWQDNCKIFFGGLHFALPEKVLRSFLSSADVPTPKEVYMNNSGGSLKPACAFATFENPDDAAKALKVHGVCNQLVSPSSIKASSP